MQKPTLPDYETLTTKLVSYIEDELANIRMLDKEASDNLETSIFQLLLNTNAIGLLSEEFVNKALEIHGTSNDFRQVMESAAIRFEAYLNFEHLKSSEEFTKTIIGILAVGNTERAGAASVTSKELLSTRMRITERFDGCQFNNPVDFWLVCLFVLRLNIHKSKSYEFLANFHDQLRQAEAGKTIQSSLKEAAAERRARTKATVISNTPGSTPKTR